MKKLIVGIIGETNSGKSSFFNAILKEKKSIVSPLTQTTCKEIYGQFKDSDYEITFIDTPGVNLKYKETERIAKHLVKKIDIVIFFFSTDRIIKDFILDQAIYCKIPKIAIINKIDKFKKSKALLMSTKISHLFNEIFYISSKNGDGVEDVLNSLKSKTIESDNLIETPIIEDGEFIEELVREIIFNNFYEEVPYQANFQLLKIENNKMYFLITAPSRHRSIYLSKIKYISQKCRFSINEKFKSNFHFFLNFKFI